MLKKLFKPSIEELNGLRFEATDGGKITEEDWVKENCRIIRKTLSDDPRRYRSYGPYWWIVKRALNDNGMTDFGTTIDLEWAEQADYGNTFLNLLAAWLYQEEALNTGLIYSNAHTIAFEPEEEGVEHDISEYQLIDDEVEILAMEG